MSPPPPEIQKPKLNKAILEDHGIFFDEQVRNGEDLDDWIRPIRKQLIRLRKLLPKDAEMKFTKELKDFQKTGQDIEGTLGGNWSLKPIETEAGSVYAEPEWYQENESVKKIKVEIDACREIAKDARRWRERNEKEPRWTSFLQKYFFRAFHEVNDNPNGHDDTFVRWELHEDLHWNEFREWTNINPKVRQLTGPKPDLTYAFPIIDITKKKNSSYLLDQQVENFTLPVLGKLRNRKKSSLQSAPTTALHKWAKREVSSLGAADLICFPWAIVEVKRNRQNTILDAGRRIARKNEANEQFCYCQAANASAAALTIRENLAVEANDLFELRDALVIFSFTCVGPSVKLWATYRRKPSKNSNRIQPITMICIWATSLELTWGVIALRMVIKNMHEWVYDNVKREISRWIRMVNSRPSPQTSLTPGGDEVVRSRRAASCEPLSERPEFPSVRSPYRTPRSKAPPPTLSRGKTVPDHVDRRKFKVCIPKLQLNSCVGRDVHNMGDEEDGEETDSEKEADEGYVSNHIYGHQSEEEQKNGSSESDSNDEEHEIESVSRSSSWYSEDYVPSESEEEEDESSGEDESLGETDEDGEIEEYYIGRQRHQALGLKPKMNCSPAKDYNSKNKPRRDQSSRPGLRRRSSQF